MAGKRRNGEGQIRRREDGRWEARFRYRDPLTGAAKRGSVYAASERDVRVKLKEKLARVETGRPVRDSKETLAVYAERWAVTTLAAGSRKESTRDTYRTIVRRRIVPSQLGGMRLDRIQPRDVDTFIVGLTRVGAGRTVAPASASTKRQTFALLGVILESAVRDGLVAANPARRAERPRSGEKRAVRALSGMEVGALLGALDGKRAEGIVRFMLATGLRRGEALALKWRDVDLTGRRVHVRGTLARTAEGLTVTPPKTAKARRAVGLTAADVAVLRSRQAEQAAERLAAGPNWRGDARGEDYVFTTREGGPWEPHNLLRDLQTAANRAGLAGVTVHALRHTAASHWLDAGVPLATVSKLLGHSTVSITADTYGHLLPDAETDAADKLAKAYGWA